jgi:glutamyl/glutaminyl-tRNA synthetase
MEDLDRSRVRPGVEEDQLSDLRTLGLDWDGPVARQSERMELYKEAIARLDAGELLYPCVLYARGDPGRRIRAARYPGFRPLSWHLP